MFDTRFRVLALISLLVAAGTVSAAALPAPLEAAIKDVESRKEAAAELRFTFKVHTVTSEKEYRFRYDPKGTEVWTILSPETKETAKIRERMAKRAEKQEKGADRELLAGDFRELIGDHIELVENTTERRVYRFDLSDQAKIGAGGGGFDASKYLTGELAIGPENRLLWLRFYAEKAFKPAFVAKIKTFDLKLFFDPIWPDGPYVTVRQAMNVNGSAFFKSFAENVKTDYSDFEKR
ncbi:MAG: hypothetical protein IH848_01540 [Acidobacteria bacterium]|nr:hypothetical protein [Acidobacteriota bacterium]